MKTTATLIIAAVLLSASPAAADQAQALQSAADGPSAVALGRGSMSKRHKVLYASVRSEVDAVKAFVDIIRTGLNAKGVTMSAAARASYKNASALYKQAKQLHDAGKYRDGYEKARAAFVAMKPAMNELFQFNHAPTQVQRAIGRVISVTASRLEFLEGVLAGHASSPSKGIYNQGKALYQEAKTLSAAGKNKQAFQKIGDALKKLDKAIRANWPESR